MTTIIRFDSRPIQTQVPGSLPTAGPPMKFQCDPFLVSLLRAVPIDPTTDLTPPEGSIEAGAITYVAVNSTDVHEGCGCGIKYSGLSAPKRVEPAEEANNNNNKSVLCPRCVFANVTDPKLHNPILSYCQFAFVKTTHGCRVESYLVSVVTGKPHRGKGLCKKLLSAALRDLASSTPTLQRVKLHTAGDMKKLIDMYSGRDFGFTVRRTVRRYYRQPIVRDAVEMELANVERFRPKKEAVRREREQDGGAAAAAAAVAARPQPAPIDEAFLNRLLPNRSAELVKGWVDMLHEEEIRTVRDLQDLHESGDDLSELGLPKMLQIQLKKFVASL